MNKYNKLTSIIKSCRTIDQLTTCFEWLQRLKLPDRLNYSLQTIIQNHIKTIQNRHQNNTNEVTQ